MKNILTGVIALLLMVFIVLTMINGFSIGKFEILSVSKIIENGKKLDTGISNINELKNTTYKQKINGLEASTKKLVASKQEYLDIASTSTDNEIKTANLQQTYTMEFLWSKIGSYATKQGVNLKFEVTPNGKDNTKTLNFTVVGSYIGIINYISKLENDSDLAFRIENFKMVSGGDAEQLNATFSVLNIIVKTETTNTTPNTTQSKDNTEILENTNDTVNSTSDIANEVLNQ